MTTWIHRRPDDEITAARVAATGPLAGWTVGVKDNLDVSGMPTTAACPSWEHHPLVTAPAVQRLVDAGAVVVGKTNLDQFATGLVGTRSPYGVVESPAAPGLIAGGSSSGSAAAVAAGAVDLGVGTDTAGSGRVPAACCGVVGLKGTRGWVPTRGVVPACPSFDCTTVFARDLPSAVAGLRTMAGPDRDDVASRDRPLGGTAPVERVGVPSAAVLDGCDDRTQDAFAGAVDRARSVGFEIVPVDLDAYLAAGELLYGGAFVAERTAAFGDIVDAAADADPSVAVIVVGGREVAAVDYRRDVARLGDLAVGAARVWDDVDAVLLPTIPFHPSVDDVAADPLGVNGRLGRFVSGCNLVDWCAAAIPQPAADGRPFGVQLLGPAWSDEALWAAAARLLDQPIPPPDGLVPLVVAGAHLRGEPLVHQLTDRGAVFLGAATTTADYRMVALPGDIPKPGLIRTATGGGAIEVEVWGLDAAGFGSFVAQIPAPLGVGTVTLDDGRALPGFLCEAVAADGATDITALGGWRAYRATR